MHVFPTPDSYLKPSFSPFRLESALKFFPKEAQSLRHEPAVASFAWHIIKAIFSPFTQNTLYAFLSGTSGQKLSFCNITHPEG